MNAKKIEERIIKIETTEKDYIKAREDNRLSLRKTQINQYLSKKRDQILKSHYPQNKINFSVESLNIPNEYINKVYTNEESFCNDMKSLLSSNNKENLKFALHQICDKSKSEENSLEVLYNNNIVDCVMLIMAQNLNDKSIIDISLWILINFSAKINKIEYIRYISRYNCLSLYEKIWAINDDNLNDSILWLLNNFLIDCKEETMHFCNSNLLNKCIIPTIENTRSFSHHTLQLYTGIFVFVTQALEKDEQFNSNNIIKDKSYLEEKITRLLCNFLFAEQNCISKDCLVGLSKISGIPNHRINDIIFSSGVVREVIKKENLIPNEFTNVTIILIGNFLSETEMEMIDPIIKEEIISFLSKYIIHSNDKEIKRNAYWCLSNITAESTNEFKIIFDNGVIQKIVESIQSEDINTSKEALFCLSNMLTSNDIDTVIKISQYNIITVLINAIGKFENKIDAMMLIIEGLYGLFDMGENLKDKTEGKNVFIFDFWKKGGKEILEKLQNSRFNQINRAVATLIKKFFNAN